MPQKAKKEHKPYIVEEIPFRLIDISDQQIRDEPTDDEIGDLAQNITAVELLQVPGVHKEDNGRYTLLWGRRRLEAYRRNGEESIPCHLYDGPVKAVKLLALIENNQRRQNSVKEECRCVDTLHNDEHLSVDQICNALGRSRSWVLTRLAIPNFPADCREALLDGTISLGVAEEIATLENEGDRAFLLAQAIHTKASFTEVRAAVQIAKATPQQTLAIEAGLEVSREQYAQQPMLMYCAACGEPTPLSKLTVIRVHAGGCPSSPDSITSEAAKLIEEQSYAR